MADVTPQERKSSGGGANFRPRPPVPPLLLDQKGSAARSPPSLGLGEALGSTGAEPTARRGAPERTQNEAQTQTRRAPFR